MNECHVDGAAIIARYDTVVEKVADAARKAGRNPEDVKLIAVSKRHPAESIKILNKHGQLDFGENYVQEVLAKQEELAELTINWHFIGHLQSKKAKDVAGKFALIHSIDRLALAQKLQNRMEMLPVSGLDGEKKVQDILLQVNIGDEAQKSGVDKDGLFELAEKVAAFPLLRIRGLMGMPPASCIAEEARPFFSNLRELRDELSTRIGVPMEHLSMGMTQDYVQAIEEGATFVRIGTEIFGPRPY
ncbi:YggS family pyridoxal phosphate-dependent enzyme [Halodesulfovibrio sp. MK-HDV]|jgi:PLP dependent protein|uniref:YggS family pyridoxal phosphate-dependent enzyme n=1 Tax=unclassified Halodesulfovibrio TaxID=2644657 RepID=UPI00136970D8|nr:YggS family pyridoxal phosphate-dependent enzyme [Halodesulfovibrio sp. MK-HDV]KAF1076472.1 Pyridoxal phosphate homeostasis protein [Halodesulfovibrio sp. MK-HDV]